MADVKMKEIFGSTAIPQTLKKWTKTAGSLSAAAAKKKTQAGQYKTARFYESKRVMGKPIPKMNPDNVTVMLKERMTRLGNARKLANLGHGGAFLTMRDASVGLYNAIQKAGQECMSAFGIDAAGQARRATAASQWSQSSGVGKFRAYSVSSGVLRGGMTGHGQDVGNGTYAIPINCKGDSRRLTQIQARYVDPLQVPAVRIVKFIRGRFGANLKGSVYEGLW